MHNQKKTVETSPSNPLEILYRDEAVCLINKPSGLLVHRTSIAQDREFAMQKLRDQLGCYVYPIHRLDRATSGVLVFALTKEAARSLCDQFETHTAEKEYIAVVRGYTDETGCIEIPMRQTKEKDLVAAKTKYVRLGTVELPHAVGRYQSVRYSLLRVLPLSGRMHQIRRHLKYISHPVIGDTTHGDTSHNKFFRDHFACNRLLLHAQSLLFTHPHTEKKIRITANYDCVMRKIISTLFGC